MIALQIAALARRYRWQEPPDSIELEGAALLGMLPAEVPAA